MSAETTVQAKILSKAEKKAFAKSRNILEVADSLGIKIERVGRRLQNAEHPSQVFYPETNTFRWFRHDIGGDTIALTQAMSDMSYTRAIDYLNTETFNEVEIAINEKPPKPFYYYLKDSIDNTQAKEYLIQERGLSSEIVNRLFDEGYLVQSEYSPFYPENDDKYPCIVAKWERHGELVGGTIQGLVNDPESFGKRGRDKRIMANVEKNFGWNYTVGTPNQIIFAESFIDALSYWSLHPHLDNFMLVDIEGLKEKTVLEFMKELVIEKKGSYKEGIIMAVDNDTAGQTFIDKLSKYKFTEAPEYQLAQPMNQAILQSNMLLYQRVAAEFNVDKLAIAAVHKAFTNGSSTNELANGWKNEQFYGKALKPSEKPQEIDLVSETTKVAEELVKVKGEGDSYDFIRMVTQSVETPESRAMGEKIQRFFNLYKSTEPIVVDEIHKDQNDLLKAENKKSKKVENLLNKENGEGKLMDSKENILVDEHYSLRHSLGGDYFYKANDNKLWQENNVIGIWEYGTRSKEGAIDQLIGEIKGLNADQVRELIQDDPYNAQLNDVEVIPIVENQAHPPVNVHSFGELQGVIADANPAYKEHLLATDQAFVSPTNKEKELPEGETEKKINQEVSTLTPTNKQPSFEEQVQTAEVLVAQDRQNFDELMVNMSPEEIMTRSEEMMQRNLAYYAIRSELSKQEGNTAFIQAVIDSKEPISVSKDMFNQVPFLSEQGSVPQEEFAQAFIDFVDSKKQGVDFKQGLPELYVEQVELILSTVKNELNKPVEDHLLLSRDLNLSLQLNFLKEKLVEQGLLVETDERLLPGPALENLPETNELRQVSYAMTAFQNKEMIEVATTLSNLTIEHKEPKKVIDLAEQTNTNLQSFKEWAHSYDGVGKDYVPISEIEQLEVTPDNKIELESVNTWFDSLEQYLQTHNEFPFGQSLAFQNAKVFVENINDPNRDLIVLEDKVKTFETVLLDAREEADVPESVRGLFEHMTFSWADVSEDSITIMQDEPILKDKLSAVMVINDSEKGPFVFSDFEEFEKFALATDQQGIEKMAMEVQKDVLSRQLDTLKEWHKSYNGRDKEYIPTQEIQNLSVGLNDENVYVIQDVMDDSFKREYKDVSSYLNSFDGNVWSETASFESAQRFFDNREDARFLTYELLKEDFLARKEEALGTLSNEDMNQTNWSNIYVISEDQLKENQTSKFLYYQDPNRAGNPLFFKDVKEAQAFVEKTVTSPFEKEAIKEEKNVGFFRRVRKENKDIVKENENKKLEDKLTPKITSREQKMTEKVKTDAPVQATEKPVGKSTKEILEFVKNGVSELMNSERYKQYLKALSQFPSYSWRNTLLIQSQNPKATHVAGFRSWQKNFERHVIKGQKGIRILAPIIQETEVEKNVNGQKKMVKEKKVTGYHPISVFDVSQTEGKELPSLVKELQGTTKDYSKLFEAIAATTDFKISFDEIKNGAKGYCDMTNRKIVLQTGMSEIQTIKTLVHEVTHSQLHSQIDLSKANKRTLEVEAESTAFVICSHLGIDTSEYSFGYLASWSSGKEVEEITKSFSTIQKHADKLITSISENLNELSKEVSKENSLETKVDKAKLKSKEHNQFVKKSQAPTQQKNHIKPPKER